MILESYMRTGNKLGAESYLRANGIKSFCVQRHHLGEPGFQLWEMTDETCGWPESFRLKRDAIRVGRKLSEFTGLPLEIQ